MKILTTSRHIDLSSNLKESLEDKIKKVLKNIKDDVIEVHVAIAAEKSRQSVEIKVLTNYTTFRCLEETHDVTLSIDKAIDVLDRQIRKNKQKFQTKRRKLRGDNFESPILPELPITIPDYSETDSSDLEVIKTNKFAAKPMSIDEALDQLKISGDQFIVFLNSVTNEVNVLYQRHDGKFGLIEPDF
jgi:putative sigma-54 modulation protein